MSDERKGQYKYNWEYDSDANTKIKSGLERPRWVKTCNYIFSLLVLSAAVVVMLLFENLLYEDPEADDDSEPFSQNSFITTIFETIDPMSILYAEVIAAFSYVYYYGAVFFVGKYNYQYRVDYNIHLEAQLFMFNFLNVFIPIGYTCFYKRNFYAVFNLLLILLTQDELNAAFKRLAGPWLTGIK